METTLISCPKCERKWPKDCEQGICIEKFEECVVCKFTPLGEGSNDGTKQELVDIYDESLRRAVQ